MKEVIGHLESGGILAYPTETVWGLGVDIYQAKAIENLFALKGRDFNQPMSVLVSTPNEATTLAHMTAFTRSIIGIVWPGPITLVLPARDLELARRLGGEDFIGIRCSNHPYISELLFNFNNPITTTSANLSGQPPALSAKDLSWLPETVKVASTNELAAAGLSSTVVKVSGPKYEVLSKGSFDLNLFQRLVKPFGLTPTNEESDED